MSKREKIILLIMAVIVVAGSYMLLTDSGTNPSVSDTTMAEATHAKQAVGKEIANLSLSDSAQYAVQQVNIPWPSDPFRKMSLEQDVQSELRDGAGSAIAFLYTAYVAIGGTSVGVINGREYEPGEMLEEPGYRLLSVGPEKVVIAGPGKDNTIVVPYQDGETE
jgi:hypothetical protein